MLSDKRRKGAIICRLEQRRDPGIDLFVLLLHSAVLPNDWQEGKVRTSDTFWKMDVSTGKKERLVDPEKIDGSYDVLYPFLSQDEKSLFFV